MFQELRKNVRILKSKIGEDLAKAREVRKLEVKVFLKSFCLRITYCAHRYSVCLSVGMWTCEHGFQQTSEADNGSPGAGLTRGCEPLM